MKCEECDREFDPEDCDHVIAAAYPVCSSCNEDFLIEEENWRRQEECGS